MQCERMDRQELLDLLNDPDIPHAMKQAAYRALFERFGVEILEDEDGNKILVGADGQPLLDKDGRPIMVLDEMLEDLGATLGQGVVMEDVDLFVLSEMCKGKTREEAEAEVAAQRADQEFAKFMAKAGCDVVREAGPIEGTWNVGLSTIQIPPELQALMNKGDNSKIYVDKFE